MKFENGHATDNRMIFAILCGMIAMVGVCVVLALIAPILILNNVLNETSIIFIAIFIHIICVTIGSAVAGAMVKERKWLAMCICSCAYGILLICAALLFFDGLTGNVAYVLLACAVGTVSPLLFNKKKSTIYRRKIRRHR